MGVLFLGLIWVIVRRMTPNASFWVGAKINAKVLLVFLSRRVPSDGHRSLECSQYKCDCSHDMVESEPHRSPDLS
jgi:hypothetical protein